MNEPNTYYCTIDILIVAGKGSELLQLVLELDDLEGDDVMGSILEKIFKGKSTDMVLLAPMDGELIDLSVVTDLTFSQRLLGDGFAIEPKEGTIIAPVSGTVSVAAGTLRTVCITADNGVEIMIHAGIKAGSVDPSELETFVELGQKVEAGDVIMKMDLEQIRENGGLTTTPVIITNCQEFIIQLLEEKGTVIESGTPVVRLKEAGKNM